MFGFEKKEQILEQKTKIFKLNFDPDKNYINEYKTLLNSLYGLQYTNSTYNNPIFTFGIKSKGENTDFYLIIPEDYINIFKKKYAVVNPYFELEEIEDPINQFTTIIQNKKQHYIKGYSMELMYNDEDKTLKDNGCEKIFMSNLLNSMNNISNSGESIIEISIQVPNSGISINVNGKITKKIIKGTDIIVKGITSILDSTISGGQLSKYYLEERDNINNENDNEQEIKIDFEPKFNVGIKIMSKSIDKIEVIDNIKAIATTFADLSQSNSLIPKIIEPQEINKREVKLNNCLTSSQIVQFLHLPDRNVLSENMNISNCRKLYDRNVSKEGIIFGESNNENVAFPMASISVKKYQQLYPNIKETIDNISKPRLVLGQQGTGKSEWLIHYIINMTKLGIGVIVVDPKNDTQQRLIESLPHDLINKVEYINFGDTKYPPGMNIFKKRKQNDPTENSLIVTSFLSLMKKEFGRNWGFKIQRTLQMSAETILLNEHSTLAELELMLMEPVYREYMIDKMKNMLKDKNRSGKAHIKKLLKYWERFHERKQRDIDRDIEPVMNQIGVFLSNRLIKAIVSQKEGFDFRSAADNGKIVIINIPEGTLGDNTNLLASMINKSIWLDLQSRANVDISKRYPVAWVIDEAHEIVDNEFVSVLTKARAYRLGLTLVTQGLSNFKMRGMDDVRELITTNCKNKIAFRLGFSDSREMSEEYEPLTATDLGNCPDYHFYSKVLLEDGSVSNPFFCKALYPAKKIRNYDKYANEHRFGKMTINEIEDQLEERFESIQLMNKLKQK